MISFVLYNYLKENLKKLKEKKFLVEQGSREDQWNQGLKKKIELWENNSYGNKKYDYTKISFANINNETNTSNPWILGKKKNEKPYLLEKSLGEYEFTNKLNNSVFRNQYYNSESNISNDNVQDIRGNNIMYFNRYVTLDSKLKKDFFKLNSLHYFNFIPYTKWPYYISFTLFLFVFYAVCMFAKIKIALPLFVLAVVLLFYFIFAWFEDVTIESTIFGKYNRKVKRSLLMGFWMFLISEIFFFAGFFWAFLDRVFHPTAYVGMSSLPLSMDGFALVGGDLGNVTWGLRYLFLYDLKPIFAGFILYFSGVCANSALYYLKIGNHRKYTVASCFCILAGLIFVLMQLEEYKHLLFNFGDSVYATCFYSITGLHGLHVIVGLFMLYVQLERGARFQLHRKGYMGLLTAVIYWHFVDIIWVFVVFIVYASNLNSAGMLTQVNVNYLSEFTTSYTSENISNYAHQINNSSLYKL